MINLLFQQWMPFIPAGPFGSMSEKTLLKNGTFEPSVKTCSVCGYRAINAAIIK
jgi:hypothetical protein